MLVPPFPAPLSMFGSWAVPLPCLTRLWSTFCSPPSPFMKWWVPVGSGLSDNTACANWGVTFNQALPSDATASGAHTPLCVTSDGHGGPVGCGAVVYCTLWCGCVFVNREGEKAEETLLVPSNDASWWHGVLCCAVLWLDVVSGEVGQLPHPQP